MNGKQRLFLYELQKLMAEHEVSIRVNQRSKVVLYQDSLQFLNSNTSCLYAEDIAELLDIDTLMEKE